MTKCNTDSLRFTRHGRRQVVADFLGGRLTTDAGALLLREVDRQIGLTEAINECIPDPRDPRYVVHDQQAMLAQQAEILHVAGADLDDIRIGLHHIKRLIIHDLGDHRHSGGFPHLRQNLQPLFPEPLEGIG